MTTQRTAAIAQAQALTPIRSQVVKKISRMNNFQSMSTIKNIKLLGTNRMKNPMKRRKGGIEKAKQGKKRRGRSMPLTTRLIIRKVIQPWTILIISRPESTSLFTSCKMDIN